MIDGSVSVDGYIIARVCTWKVAAISAPGRGRGIAVELATPIFLPDFKYINSFHYVKSCYIFLLYVCYHLTSPKQLDRFAFNGFHAHGLNLKTPLNPVGGAVALLLGCHVVM